jgi:hypothetical protein
MDIILPKFVVILLRQLTEIKFEFFRNLKFLAFTPGKHSIYNANLFYYLLIESTNDCNYAVTFNADVCDESKFWLMVEKNCLDILSKC